MPAAQAGGEPEDCEGERKVLWVHCVAGDDWGCDDGGCDVCDCRRSRVADEMMMTMQVSVRPEATAWNCGLAGGSSGHRGHEFRAHVSQCLHEDG